MEEPKLAEIEMLRGLLAYQFGRGAEKILEGELRIKRSKATGRVREVYVDGVLLGTIRASDGFFIPSLRGAVKLLEHVPYPRLRVVVPHEVAAHVARGRTVFCKHVVDVDLEIRPGDEVVVVDEDDRVVAVGKAVVSGIEMLTKSSGKAVKVRRGSRQGLGNGHKAD